MNSTTLGLLLVLWPLVMGVYLLVRAVGWYEMLVLLGVVVIIFSVAASVVGGMYLLTRQL